MHSELGEFANADGEEKRTAACRDPTTKLTL
jgi:hypothetical protein